MKKGPNVLLILCVVLAVVPCGKTKSYTDMLKDGKKATKRSIDDKGLGALDNFPADNVFKENQFVLLDNGVYLDIIDKGSNQKVMQYKTKMLHRCRVSYFMDSTIVAIENYDPHSNRTSPIAFTYGDYPKNSSYDPSYYYVSEGMQEPLKYVGNRARVRMIVPLKGGTHNGQSNDQSTYYEVLECILEENL